MLEHGPNHVGNGSRRFNRRDSHRANIGHHVEIRFSHMIARIICHVGRHALGREKSRGKTVDEAVTAALIELGVSSDQVNIEIVDEGTKGILGLFSKEAKVRVSLKSSDQGETVEKEIEEEVAKELEPIQSEIDSFSEGSDQADEPRR